MRKLFLLLLTALPLCAQTNVSWTPSPGSARTLIYADTNLITTASQSNAPVKMSLVVPTSTAVLPIANLTTSTQRWWVVATAVDAFGLESKQSNQVTTDLPPAATPVVLEPPANLRVK